MFIQCNGRNRIEKKYKSLQFGEIPIVDNYKYLGIIIDNANNYKLQTDNIIKKIKEKERII